MAYRKKTADVPADFENFEEDGKTESSISISSEPLEEINEIPCDPVLPEPIKIVEDSPPTSSKLLKTPRPPKVTKKTPRNTPKFARTLSE